jgi:phage/plasmid-like protein (TIGR03299 family)
MAHNLTFSNGRAALAYAAGGAVPWHRHGQALPDDASIQTWREASGMDWSIQSAPVLYQQADGTLGKMPDKVVLYRSDNAFPLSVVSDGYKPVQPGTVLEFFRGLSEKLGAKLETAGTLRGGRKFWSMARLPVEAEAGRLADGSPDRHKLYIVLTTSADGSLATIGQRTSVRVVCENTLNAALARGGDAAFRVSHRSDFDVDSAYRSLGVDVPSAIADWRAQIALLKEAGLYKVSVADADIFFRALLRPPKADGTAATETTREPRGLDSLLTSYLGAPGAMPGTARGLLEGVTHWVDHTRGTDADKRHDSAWYGQGARLKAQAWETVARLVETGHATAPTVAPVPVADARPPLSPILADLLG